MLSKNLPDPDSLFAAWSQYRVLLGYLVVIGILCYATELTYFSLHMDSELHALDYEAADDWIAQGRWGLYVLNALLLPNTIMPVIPMLLAISGLVAGSLLLLLSLSDKRGFADYIAAPIAVTCPILYFALYYTTIGYGIGIGYAVMCAGFYALTRATRTGFTTATLCFAFATGVYQAFLPLTVVLGGFWLTARVIDRCIQSARQAWQHILVFAAALLASIIVYVAATQLALAWTDIDYASGYLSGFINYSLTASYLVSSLQSSLITLLNIYTGNGVFYLHQHLTLPLLFLSTLMIVCHQIWRNADTMALRGITCIVLLVALFAPASLLMMNNGAMPARVLFPAATVLAGLVFISLQTQQNIIRWLVASLAIISIYHFVVTNNRFAFTNRMAWEADREFTTALIQRLDRLQQDLPITPSRQRIPIEIVGTRALPDIPVFEAPDLIGSSVFERVPAEITPRLTLVMRAMGNLDYRAARPDEKLAVFDAARQMPLWPLEGAVAVVNGVIVVKLGDYHPEQIPVQ